MPPYSAPPVPPPRPPLALYRPGHVVQRFVIGSACAVTVVLVASAIAAFPAADDPTFTDDNAPLTSAVTTYLVTFYTFLLMQLVSYFVTCAWLHLVRRNAEVLNPTYEHSYSVGWVWGSWLVPIVNLWFPYQVVADVRGATSPPGRSAGWVLGLWWAAWLLLGFTLNITSTVFPAAGVSDKTWASLEAPIQSLAALFSVVALVAWVRIVRDITSAQARAAAEQGWSPALAQALMPPVTSPVTTPSDTPGWTPGGPPSAYAEPPSPYGAPPAPYPARSSPYAGWPDQGSPGGPGGPGVWWGRSASAAMGVWALVLALLPLFVTWLVSIGLAVAVLLRPDDGWRRGRGPAIAGLVISSVWILLASGLFIAAGYLPEPESGSVASSKNDNAKPDPEKGTETDTDTDPLRHALKVGDCIRKVPKAVDYTVNIKVAACRVPHRAQVYAVWALGEGPYPSVDRLVDLADDGCMKRFSSFIGHDYYSSNLELTYLTPDDSDWRNHSRTVTCIVYDSTPFTGTLRGSLR